MPESYPCTLTHAAECAFTGWRDTACARLQQFNIASLWMLDNTLHYLNTKNKAEISVFDKVTENVPSTPGELPTPIADLPQHAHPRCWVNTAVDRLRRKSLKPHTTRKVAATV